MPDWRAWPFPTEDPYPAYHAAREQAPVQWNEPLGAHLVLSHEHAAEVLRSPEWSSDPRNSPQMLASLGGPGPVSEQWSRSLLMSDPPAHTRLRTAVNRFFTPRAVRAIRGRVAAIVDSAFAALADGEPVELMSELAYPIPLAVIAELFDIGLEGAELLRSETPTIARMLELDPTPEEIEAIGTAAMTVMLFLVPIVTERREDPGEDLLSALVHPPGGGAALETEEIITMCLLLLAAGHETTANLIGNGTLALFEHPEQLDWLAGIPTYARKPSMSSCATTAPPRSRLASPETTSYSAESRSARDSRRSSSSVPPTATQSATPTQTNSTSLARRRPTSRSGTGRTSASAPDSLDSRPRRRSPTWHDHH